MGGGPIGRIGLVEGAAIRLTASDPGAARWQDRLDRPWGWIAGGCHANRDTVAGLERAGFTLTSLRRFPWGPPSPSRPHVSGAAVP